MSTLKVDGIRSNSATSDAITLASDGTCNANISSVNGGSINTNNLVDNGAMLVKQRKATSNTTGGVLVDRFALSYGNHDEVITQSQVDVASGTTPYTLGFRKAYKLTNGNQTSGANAADFVGINHVIESQNVASSGWNYNSTSSYISVSFWIKSSVAQKYYMRLFSSDGTVKVWVIDTGVLSANTWTKVTDKIPGHADLQFDNDNGHGLSFQIIPYYGTDFTDNSVPVGSWTASSGAAQVPDMTTTWWTTNDATFEVTGIQIEVSDHVTPFQFRSYNQELDICQRYLQVITQNQNEYLGAGHGWSTNQAELLLRWDKEMRTAPTLDSASGTNYFVLVIGGGNVYLSNWIGHNLTKRSGLLYKNLLSGFTNGLTYRAQNGNASAYVYLKAEF